MSELRTDFTLPRAMLMATLMLAPFVFGAVQAWAWGAMSIGIACILLLWAIACVCGGSVQLRWCALYIPALALLGLAGVQLQFALTMDRIATREALLKLLTYTAIFFLTQHLFAEAQPSAWRTAGLAIAVYAFGIALFAVLQFLASPWLLYGVITPQWGGYVFGPYVYHNAYAGLLEMLIPLSAAQLLSLTAPGPTAPRAGACSEIAGDVAQTPRSVWPRNAQLAILAFFLLICLLSLFLSGSRGGSIALAVECALFAGLFAKGTRSSAAGIHRMLSNRTILVFACSLLLGAAAFVSWLDPGEVSKRWQMAAHSPVHEIEARARLTADCLRMARAHLAHGVGLGAFEAAYPTYQSLAADFVIDYAHDDYVQLFAEAGLVGWFATPVGIGIFLWLAFGGLRWPLTSDAWLRIGAAVGVCGLLVHSVSDFNLHIPANAAWFAFSCGLATAGR